MQTWPGIAFPQGATFDGAGTNFSVYSEAADAIRLCLFDERGREERVVMTEVDNHCHHVYLPGIKPGQRYGYRVHGPWDPGSGLRCNPKKLLIDPYAKAVEGEIEWDRRVYAHRADNPMRMDRSDSARNMPRSVVINPWFDWGDDVSPRRSLAETVIYEAHVRGMTMTHPDVAPELRGTYAGFASEPILDHLVDLGVTAVELMPVHQFVDDHHLVEKGLTNYWGYQTLSYLAPHNKYAAWGTAGELVAEFKHLVKALHARGIEVILDVVYNHTAEGDHLGPSLSLRGVDNATYYRLDADDPSRYVDYTGCGNSLNPRSPQVLRLIMDSLRYWVLEMHVDGFRFDLASALAREMHDVDRLAAFFDIIQQDPIISQVKLIAEPWDLGEGGYQVGNFPILWSEWNGKYRDGIRRYWRGDDQTLADFAYRLTGSSDLYANSGRRPAASINFVTAHDGFTLRDLTSYRQKHNEANGEDNRDGESHNLSWNWGVEGETDDEWINEHRQRSVRSVLATLFLSQGVPMITMGDELGRTQGGNNNAYCQDNPIGWIDWRTADRDLIEFCQSLARIRADHPVFRRRRWFHGKAPFGSGVADIAWFTPAGKEMTQNDWEVGFAKSLGVWLNGDALQSPGPTGQKIYDDSFLVFFNSHTEPISFVVSDTLPPESWSVAFDTSGTLLPGTEVASSENIEVPESTVILLAAPRPDSRRKRW